MKVEVVTSEIRYTIPLVDICKKFNIPEASEFRAIDYVDAKFDSKEECLIIEQIEPEDVSRPKSDEK